MQLVETSTAYCPCLLVKPRSRISSPVSQSPIRALIRPCRNSVGGNSLTRSRAVSPRRWATAGALSYVSNSVPAAQRPMSWSHAQKE